MATTMSLFYDLGQFVDKVLRGQKVGGRATVNESMLDVMPSDAREIVYGMAFSQWTGAKLRTLVDNVGSRWYPLFLRVMQKRLERSDPEADYEREALIDLLEEFKVLHPSSSNEIETILRQHRADLSPVASAKGEALAKAD